MNFILYLIYAVLIIGPIYLVWALYHINRKIRKIEWLNSQEYTVLRIDVPRLNDKSPLNAEQMFASIHGIYSESAKFQNHVSFEIVAKDKYIQFYTYLPVHLKDFVEGQIYAQYPNVEIHEVDDYASNIDVFSTNFAVAELSLNKPDVYPIKQFTDFEVDPISGITSVMTKLNQGEEVWFQMVISPIGDKWQEKGHRRVNSVRTGVKPTNNTVGSVILRGLLMLLRNFFLQVLKPGEMVDDTKEVKLPASVEEALKSIEQKITKLGFESKIRIMSISPDPVSARMRCQNVAAAFKQYNTNNLNGFKIGDIYLNNKDQWKDYAFRSFEGHGEIFNISELASLYHFPHASVATPNIVWSGSKKGEPPANLPIRDNTPSSDFTVLGQTNFRNEFIEFGIKRDDRRRHIYIVGKSGVGKSTLIENMAVNDIAEGRGVIIVDPHGETADKALACVPSNRINDVVVFDPSDRDFPIAFNILESVDDDFKGLVASGFVGIFKKIFDKSWGPRLEHILRNTVLALLDYPNSTMLDIPRMLTNARFRDAVMEHVKDPVIREFWLNEFASFDNKFRTEAVAPILNKVGQFLASSTIRNIVGQPKSSIDIRQIMDNEKIMIVNLSRGKIGEDNSALLGAMMITKIQLAAMSRANVTADKRPDCYLYVDEFQNFATDSFKVILSEARKYNLCLTVAHQYIAQLPEEVRDAVFGNAGTLITFRVGGTDADALIKEYEPVFLTNDLVNLDKFNIYIKLLVNGVSAPAFSARTLPPVQSVSGNIEQVIAHSHSAYSNARQEVEETINTRSRREDEELKQEAELFKKGGLEALLVKKQETPVTGYASSTTSRDILSSNKPSMSAVKQVEHNTEHAMPNGRRIEESHSSIPESKANDVIPQKPEPVIPVEPQIQPEVAEKVQTESSEAGDQEPKEPKEPKYIKYQNILDGKLYKERTARGGVKWYLGEEVDEEKLRKSGTLVDENARQLVEATKGLNPVRADGHRHKKASKDDHDKSKDQQAKADKSIPENEQPKAPQKENVESNSSTQPEHSSPVHDLKPDTASLELTKEPQPILPAKVESKELVEQLSTEQKMPRPGELNNGETVKIDNTMPDPDPRDSSSNSASSNASNIEEGQPIKL